MTPTQRKAAQLYVVDGLTQQEIAAELGVSQPSVSSWLRQEDVADLVAELEAAADENLVKIASHNLRSNTERLCRITKRWANSLDDQVDASVGYTILDADARYKQTQGLNLSLDALHAMQDRVLARRKARQTMREVAAEGLRRKEIHLLEVAKREAEAADREAEQARNAAGGYQPPTFPAVIVERLPATIRPESQEADTEQDEGATPEIPWIMAQETATAEKQGT